MSPGTLTSGIILGGVPRQPANPRAGRSPDRATIAETASAVKAGGDEVATNCFGGVDRRSARFTTAVGQFATASRAAYGRYADGKAVSPGGKAAECTVPGFSG